MASTSNPTVSSVSTASPVVASESNSQAMNEAVATLTNTATVTLASTDTFDAQVQNGAWAINVAGQWVDLAAIVAKLPPTEVIRVREPGGSILVIPGGAMLHDRPEPIYPDGTCTCTCTCTTPPNGQWWQPNQSGLVQTSSPVQAGLTPTGNWLYTLLGAILMGLGVLLGRMSKAAPQ